ncbi:MAG: hypothetical protein JKY42_03900 [Flavobacteriales bacterium]|nr:hypothetical protein [Flavobacteriales bacterium]
MRKIKMFWDFRGQDSLKTAEHQCIHLKEFFIKEGIEYHQIETDKQSAVFVSAFAVVNEKDVEVLRTTLRPNRGQLAEQLTTSIPHSSL